MSAAQRTINLGFVCSVCLSVFCSVRVVPCCCSQQIPDTEHWLTVSQDASGGGGVLNVWDQFLRLRP